MKTKVIAFRVTQDEYTALSEYACEMGYVGFSKMIYEAMGDHLKAALEMEERRRKAFERKQKRDAKKAEANVIE